MVTTVTIRLTWNAAHRLATHDHCKRLHGHRYVAEIEVAGPIGDDGMIIDFAILKTYVGGWIGTHWDHGVILAEDDHDAIQALSAMPGHRSTTPAPPTAETLAGVLFKKANKQLHARGVEVIRVRVYETPDCWAEVMSRRGNR